VVAKEPAAAEVQFFESASSATNSPRHALVRKVAMKYDCLFCDFTVVSENNQAAVEHLAKEHDIVAGDDDLQNYCLVIRYFSEDKESS
jgi:hypothetical protein